MRADIKPEPTNQQYSQNSRHTKKAVPRGGFFRLN
jgi:hypothetical protein